MGINVKGQCSADADVDSVADSVEEIDLNEKLTLQRFYPIVHLFCQGEQEV